MLPALPQPLQPHPEQQISRYATFFEGFHSEWVMKTGIGQGGHSVPSEINMKVSVAEAQGKQLGIQPTGLLSCANHGNTVASIHHTLLANKRVIMWHYG